MLLVINAFSLWSLLLTHRTTLCRHHPEHLAEYEKVTRSTTEEMGGVQLNVSSWSQTWLHHRHGGHWLRTATDLVLLVIPSPRAASNCLANDMLHLPTNTPEGNEEVRARLDRNHDVHSESHKQINWDDIQYSSAVATEVPVLNQHILACFKAASRPESCVWLNCVPNNRVGTFNDNHRISVALHVGLSVCITHRC